MSKRTRTQKVTIALLAILEFILGLIMVILVLVFFAGLYFVLFTTQYPIGTSIGTLAFLFILLAVIGYVTSKINKRLNENKPQRVILTRETLKQLGYIMGILFLIFLFYFGLTTYFNLFPPTISSPLIIQILQVMIQTNGFLIGFSGVVFAQMFWAIHNQMSSIQSKLLEPQMDKNKEALTTILSRFDRKRTMMILYMFGVVAFFVVSILSSLSGMAQTELHQTLPSSPNLTVPFLFFIFGIVIFMFFISQSKPSVE